VLLLLLLGAGGVAAAACAAGGGAAAAVVLGGSPGRPSGLGEASRGEERDFSVQRWAVRINDRGLENCSGNGH